jgi:hypothetical protein
MPLRESPDSYETDPEQALLTEIRSRFQYAMDQWRDIRAEAATDMRFVGGDPWSPKDRKQREDAGRVCLSLDELHQYFNQLINDVRASPRAPKFDPVGNGANDKTATFYADKMREIEYRSQAQIAYSTAFQNAVHRGYGWIEFTTKFGKKSFDQDIWIVDKPNPDLIVSDPDALRPSSSDQKYLFDLQSYSVPEFRREFPGAKITSFTPEIISQAPAWLSVDRVQIAKYWTVVPAPKRLLLLQGPDGSTATFYEDELQQMPPGATVINQRMDDEATEVCMYLTNGVELLKKPGQAEAKVRWAGNTIPFVSCFGMIIYVDEGSGPKRKILSMTRLARDPYMLYCYYRTSQAELVGMTPKIPYFIRRGSLKPDQLLLLQKSLHEPVAVIEVESFVDGLPQGAPPEFPMRNPFEPHIQQLELGAESARRAIQAAMGISPLPTQAQRRNEKSGIALQQIESTSQKGSFHFIDHYEAMLQHGGVIVEDLLPKVLDTARTVGVRDGRENPKQVRINQPPQTPEDLPSIQGDHVVTITTGPAFESQRQEGAAFTDTLVSNLQVIAGVAGPKAGAAILGMAIKLKNLGELGDEMAKIVTPPEYAQQQGQPPDPQQLQAALQQLQQENQQLQQMVQTKQGEIQAKGQIDLQKTQFQEQAETQRAQMEQQLGLQKAELAANAQIAVADIKAKSEDVDRRLKLVELFLTAQQEARLDREAKQHEHTQGVMDKAHEVGLAHLEHAHAKDLATHQAAVAPAKPTPLPSGE